MFAQISFLGILDGVTAVFVMVCGIGLGLLSLYHAKKYEANLLVYAALIIFFIGMLYLGPATDFFLVVFTGSNLDNNFGLYGILSYLWVGPAVFVAMYVGSKLLLPDKTKIVVIVYVILSVVFELFLFLDTMNSFEFTEPAVPGTDLIDSSFNSSSPTFLLIAVFLVSVLVFNGIGFLYRGLRSTGDVKKRFITLGIGFTIFFICGLADSLVSPGPALFFVRIGMATSLILIYLGLKPIV